MKLATCNCAEAKDEKGNKLPEVAGHNCEYIRARNSHIPEATSFAQMQLDDSGIKLPSDRSAFFNRVFSSKMNELCANL